MSSSLNAKLGGVPKLSYFAPSNGILGRAGPLRVLLNTHGIEFEEEFIQRPDWMAKKAEILSTVSPFGQVPILKIGDETFFDSMPIARYVCAKSGLAGTDAKVYWQEDVIAGVYEKQRGDWGAAMFGGPPDKRDEAIAAFCEKFSDFYTLVEALLVKFNMTTEQPLWGSCALYSIILDNGKVDAEKNTAALAKFPTVKKFFDGMTERTNMSAYKP